MITAFSGSLGHAARTLLLAFAALALVRPAAAEEAILDYKSRIVVNADASLTVTETLRVMAEGTAIRRGIYRAFPTVYPEPGRTVRVAFDVLEVSRDGRPEPYRVEAAGNGQVVYIGDPDALLAPGEHTYALTYRTDRQIGHFGTYDELYWNVTGGDWTLPRLRVEAVVVLPFNPEVLRRAAYTGRPGERGHDVTIDQDASQDIRFATTRPLEPGEDLTIAVAWPKGYVAEPSAAERARLAAENAGGGLVGGAGLLLFLAVSGVLWRRVGRDPKPGPVVRVTEPPRGLSPAALRYVMYGGFDDKAFAATLLVLAVKGAVSIDATGGTFTLAPADTQAAGLSAAEKRILAALFGAAGAPVALGGAYEPRVGAARAALAASLKGEHGRALFSTNRAYLIPGGVITLLTLAAIILASPSPAPAAGAVAVVAVATGVLAVFGRVGLGKWKDALSRRRAGRKAVPPAVAGTILTAAAAVMAAFAAVVALERLAPAAVAAVAGLIAGNLLFARLMAAPTAAGRTLMDAIEGFRLHLSTAGRAADLSPAAFERFLPYALALDLEDAWAEHFAAALDAAGTAPAAYRPMWYAGPPWLDRSDGPAAGATLGDGLTGAVSTSATAPGSTEGGGGSGGGGSAGGGGGGGGGGGW